MAGEEAAVLVAVAVAEHDVLLCPAALQQRQDAGQAAIGAHDWLGLVQVANRLEQWHHDQVGDGGVVVQRAAQQPALLLQQQQLQQIADRLGVADDAVAQRLPAVAGQQFGGGLEDRQLALRQL